MRIAGVNPCSLVNGDGLRYTIFTQGCFHHCKGCQNPDTWDPKGGYDVNNLVGWRSLLSADRMPSVVKVTSERSKRMDLYRI